MFFRTVLACFSFILCQVSMEFILTKDVAERITFDGSELVIEVDNGGGIIGRFTLCVKSSDQVSLPHCPTGYDQIQFSFGRLFSYGPLAKTFKINRQGDVTMGTEGMYPIQSISFTEDNALDVVLKDVPDESTKVRLLNAVRYVPPEPVLTTTPKKSVSMAVFSVVVIVLLAIAGLLIAGLIATICYCRRETPQKMEQSDDRGQKHKTLKDDRVPAPLPLKPKSGRTSSTTVTTTTVPVKSSSVASFKEDPDRKPKSALRRSSSHC
uniref:Uncharacterized protein n=1 Tax=Panagrellus redivivus TaxID=6233 RepID=A0A7E4VXG8_PANRE